MLGEEDPPPFYTEEENPPSPPPTRFMIRILERIMYDWVERYKRPTPLPLFPPDGGIE